MLYLEDRDVLLLISQERVEYHHPEDCWRLEEGSGRLQLSQSISCGISQGPEVTEPCHHQVSRAWGHPKSGGYLGLMQVSSLQVFPLP